MRKHADKYFPHCPPTAVADTAKFQRILSTPICKLRPDMAQKVRENPLSTERQHHEGQSFCLEGLTVWNGPEGAWLCSMGTNAAVTHAGPVWPGQIY